MATKVRAADTAADTRFFGHPRGLATLFFTETWERFSYYGMRAILILFMTAPTRSGGLGFSVATAGVIYGLYTSMVYLLSVPGGWVADRIFGQRRAVLYGGILIIFGQFSLGVPRVPFFYAGLVLLVLGTGLLKPNVSTIVGQLYAPGDVRRDAGFSIFYMGINLGAFIAPLAVGYVGQRVNWNLGFMLAGAGMTLGLIQYSLGSRYLGEAGLHPVPSESEEARAKLHRSAWTAAAVFALLIGAPALLQTMGAIHITAAYVGTAGGALLLVVTIGIFGWLLSSKQWSAVERARLLAILALFVASTLFWSAYEQAGSTLTLLADRSTDNRAFGFSFPSSWYQSVPAIFVIVLAPVFAYLWVRLGRRDPSTPAKFAAGLILVGLGFAVVAIGAARAVNGVRISPLWLIATYLLSVCGELCLSPVGLSAMTKLAPQRVAGLMMGVFFLSISIGDYIGGLFGSMYERFSPSELFTVVAAGTIGVGLIMALLVRPIKRLMAL
ncbi:MAG TPA: peptide MFS transporter [Bryobacteraceae bacterium]|nr:peptide MFS transporter [Bryobacteraceae bacterium]